MMSKREYERKQREEQEATAHVFQEFITTFQNNCAPPNKTFVKSEVLYAEKSETTEEKGKLYNPKPLIKPPNNTIRNAIECARILKDTKIEKSKKQGKPKSNLELLKEELKQRHSERDEKNKLKDEMPCLALSSFDGGDPSSTNLFVANLDSKITENDLMLLFGAYGPLASVKIMWPRGEERLRNSNCGFVAFMSRKDAERALNELKDRNDMRVGWGKTVEIPPSPIYIPQNLLKLYMPPPLSGLPFNAQPLNPHYKSPESENELNDLLIRSVVKVTIPLDKKVLMIVNRMVEFVVREGPMFEAIIMNKEIRNPEFNFLFDYQCPVHVYYRWKLYSILKGDGQKSWSMKPFKMYEGGSLWIPPVQPIYTEGMPDELINSVNVQMANLSTAQINRLIHLIQNLTMARVKISEAMLFCLNHVNAINDSLEIIMDSLMGQNTNLLKKVARLYLLSDVLYNVRLKNKSILHYEETYGMKLIYIFKSFYNSQTNLVWYFDVENLKTRVMKVLRYWDICNFFSASFLHKLESSFIHNTDNYENVEDDNSSNDEPLDGANLIKRSLRNNVDPGVLTSACLNVRETDNLSENFIVTKWDTVDPEEVEAQAMSTKILYYMQLEEELEELKIKQNDNTIPEEKNLQISSITSSKWDSDDDNDKNYERSFKETDCSKYSSKRYKKKNSVKRNHRKK